MNIDKQAILDLLKVIGGNGHTLYDAADEIFQGMPKELMDAVTQTHKSDGTAKGSIWRNGEMVPEMHAVYGLDLLWRLASEVGADTKLAAQKMGRGFQAQELTKALREKLVVACATCNPEHDEPDVDWCNNCRDATKGEADAL